MERSGHLEEADSTGEFLRVFWGFFLYSFLPEADRSQYQGAINTQIETCSLLAVESEDRVWVTTASRKCRRKSPKGESQEPEFQILCVNSAQISD